MRNILLATDFSEIACAAYEPAVTLAKDFGAKIHLVHQVEPVPPFYTEHVNDEFSVDTYYDGFLRRLAAEVELPVFKDCAVVPRLLREGAPYEQVVALANAEDMDLIVLSTHGRTGLAYVFLGSFADKVVRLSQVPVLTCRRGCRDFKPHEILVPFDFSLNAEAVLPTVRVLARRYRAHFTFLFVLGDPRQLVFDRFPTEHAEEALREAESRGLEKALDDFKHLRRQELVDVNTSLRTQEGPAARQIVSEARQSDADLILMATHGRTGFDHFTLGSVAEEVVRKAPCSVLTLRPEQTGASGRPSPSHEPAHFFG